MPTILRREMQDGFFMRCVDEEQRGINELTIVKHYPL